MYSHLPGDKKGICSAERKKFGNTRLRPNPFCRNIHQILRRNQNTNRCHIQLAAYLIHSLSEAIGGLKQTNSEGRPLHQKASVSHPYADTEGDAGVLFY